MTALGLPSDYRAMYATYNKWVAYICLTVGRNFGLTESDDLIQDVWSVFMARQVLERFKANYNAEPTPQVAHAAFKGYLKQTMLRYFMNARRNGSRRLMPVLFDTTIQANHAKSPVEATQEDLVGQVEKIDYIRGLRASGMSANQIYIRMSQALPDGNDWSVKSVLAVLEQIDCLDEQIEIQQTMRTA